MTTPKSFNRLFAITPSDVTTFDPPYHAIQCTHTAAANVAVRTTKGDTVTVANVQPGQLLEYYVDRVLATGTTGTWVGLRKEP